MFEYLKNRDIKDKTAWIDVPQIVPGARLLLRNASLSNSDYYNASLKLAARRTGANLPKHVQAADETRQGRDDDRVTFPGTVLVGWEGVVDDKGVEVPFSKEVAGDLLEVLPDWLFDMVRAFAMDPEQFYDPGSPLLPTPAEVEEKAGNSPSDSSGN